MAAVRMERSLPEPQFLISRPKENSWGHLSVLVKENLIRAFVGYTPVINEGKDAECMTVSLDSVIINGVQDSGFTPFEEFRPRSAPINHGIQKSQSSSFQMLKDVEVKELNPEKELNLEKELEPEKDKLVASRSTCLRSSVPGRLCSRGCRGRMPRSSADKNLWNNFSYFIDKYG